MNWYMFAGRRNYGYSMDRPFRRPSGNRGPRRPYYSHGNKRGSRQPAGSLLFCYVLFFCPVLSLSTLQQEPI